MDILLIQESGWQLNCQWTTNVWYCIHSQAASASQLIMIRKTLLRPSLLAYAVLIPGRLIHIRLMLERVHDLYTVYQTAWSTTRSAHALLHDRQDLWQKLSQDVQHTPNSHMLLIAGDFDCPLQVHPPYIGSFDPRYAKALQTDKLIFQQLVQDLSLIAVHCRQKYVPTFLHGHRQT